MAAQPSVWGAMNREGMASNRPRARRERNPYGWEHYRQSPLPEKHRTEPLPDLHQEVLLESRPNPADEAPAASEAFDEDSLPRVLSAIDRLMSPDENDGDEAATAYSYQSARAVVESAYGRLLAGGLQVKQLHPPVVTTDERGGVRLSWQHRDKHVRINFAAAEGLRSYLYFESPAEHNVEALQPSILSTRLDWMLKA